MTVLILCTGAPETPPTGKLNSAEFTAAWEAARSNGICPPPAGRKIDPAGRTVWLAEGRPAAETAARMLEDCHPVTEALLNEVEVRPFCDTDRQYDVSVWLRKAAGQRRQADPRQPESQKQLKERADKLILKLAQDGKDCILITGPLFLTELLDRFRVQNYVIQRSGIFKVQPLEKFVISEKEAHCGGCGHNCFLSNPGCGVGREKAQRRKMRG